MLYEIEDVLKALDLFQAQMAGDFSLSDFTRGELVGIIEDMLNAMPCDYCEAPSTDELIDNCYFCEECLEKAVHCYVCEMLVMPEEAVFDSEAMVSICDSCNKNIEAHRHTI